METRIITHKEKTYIQTNTGYREIIASTDKSLKISSWEPYHEHPQISLPTIPDSFVQAYIKSYNEGKPITEVSLEMTASNGEPVSFKEWNGKFDKVKTREDGSVIVHQSKLYTRDEVINLVSHARRNANSMSFEDWIKENL